MSCFRALSPHIVTAKSFAQRAAFIGALGIFGSAACSKAPADGDCEKLLLHLVEIEVKSGLASEADQAKLQNKTEGFD